MQLSCPRLLDHPAHLSCGSVEVIPVSNAPLHPACHLSKVRTGQHQRRDINIRFAFLGMRAPFDINTDIFWPLNSFRCWWFKFYARRVLCAFFLSSYVLQDEAVL
jgi:hypothetical protein